MKNKYLRYWVSLLCLAGLMIWSMPFAVYADVNDLLISTDSDAVMSLSLDDEDYSVSLMSSVGTVTNTAKDALVAIRYTNGTYNNSAFITPELVSNRWDFSFTMPSSMSGYWINEVDYYFQSKSHSYDALPSPPGNYNFSMDFASDFSYDLGTTKTNLFSAYIPDNADWEYSYVYFTPTFESGDFYIAPTAINFGSGYNNVRLRTYIAKGSNLQSFAGSYAMAFKVTDSQGADLVGSSLSYGDTVQDDMSGQLSDISSSVDSMSEDLSSASENLEYISQSQNLIIQGIDNVILHISDQLYAFWDQLYNLIHEPTYAKLEEILAALRAIANNSDIYQVVEEVRESNDKLIENDNKIASDQAAADAANTEKVTQAVEDHGNFIIDGLKGLFIPSDEFFKSYFDDLYGYFSDRFGFLSFPFDLLSRFVNLIVNSSDVDCVLTLPSFEIMDEQLLYEQSFNLTDFLEENFAFLLSAIRMGTSIILIMSFVQLCGDKWKEVMSR